MPLWKFKPCPGTCCCVVREDDFSQWPEGPPDPAKWTVVSGDWTVADGCLQTASDNAEIYPGSLAHPYAPYYEIEHLAAGAELMCKSAYTGYGGYWSLLQGGTPGKLILSDEYGYGDPSPWSAPFNVPTSFTLQFAGQSFHGSSGNLLSISDGDTRRGFYGALWRLGTRHLNGSTLKIRKFRWLVNAQECFEPATLGRINAWCDSVVGAEKGYYITLDNMPTDFRIEQFSSYDLTGLHGTYYLDYDNPRYVWDPPVATVRSMDLGWVTGAYGWNYGWIPFFRNTTSYTYFSVDTCQSGWGTPRQDADRDCAHWDHHPLWLVHVDRATGHIYDRQIGTITSDPIWP